MRDVQIKITKETAKIIAFIILFVIIFGVFLLYLAKPLYEQIKSTNAEIAKQEERLALLKTAKEKINIINKDIDDFTKRIELLKTVLPVQEDELLYVEELMILANQTNVKISSMNFPKSSATKQVEAKTFSINVNAPTLQNIMFFVDAIRNFPQITELNNWSIQKTTQTKTTTGTTELPYSAQITGIIYLSQRK